MRPAEAHDDHAIERGVKPGQRARRFHRVPSVCLARRRARGGDLSQPRSDRVEIDWIAHRRGERPPLVVAQIVPRHRHHRQLAWRSDSSQRPIQDAPVGVGEAEFPEDRVMSLTRSASRRIGAARASIGEAASVTAIRRRRTCRIDTLAS